MATAGRRDDMVKRILKTKELRWVISIRYPYLEEINDKYNKNLIINCITKINILI